MKEFLRLSLFILHLLSFPIILWKFDIVWISIPIILAILLFVIEKSRDFSDNTYLLKPIIRYKKIFHESGEFYIEYDRETEYYYLYKDYIVYMEYISKIDNEVIKSENDLKIYIKKELDILYKETLKHLNHEKILEKCDAYTSDDLKRESKINKIVK